jgi:HAD superfamily hydrolase (TIGR01549 family)
MASTQDRLPKALLFDLDGTLLDSFAVHYQAYEAMFARFGIRITRETFLASYSPNWYHTYERMGLPGNSWDDANAYWLEEAAKRQAELFPGVREMLATLGRSRKLGLVTSGSRHRVMTDLERTGIRPYFQIVVTGNDIKQPKPSPEGLELALASLGLQPHEAVYLGDSYADYEMARSAGVEFLGVSSAFEDDGPRPYRTMSSVVDLLEELIAG